MWNIQSKGWITKLPQSKQYISNQATTTTTTTKQEACNLIISKMIRMNPYQIKTYE